MADVGSGCEGRAEAERTPQTEVVAAARVVSARRTGVAGFVLTVPVVTRRTARYEQIIHRNYASSSYNIKYY